MSLLRRNAARVVAVVAIALAAWFARLPSYTQAERDQLASAFAFERLPLVVASQSPLRSVRVVQPQLRHIRGWISAVGAAVALADADGDGLPNDVCLVDPRTDSVTVAPAPSTGARYPAFVLDTRPLPFEAATTAPMGCLPGDFDDDGRTDFLAYYWGRTPVLFLRQPEVRLAPGAFRRQELVAGGGRWYTDSVVQADVDGDGRTDLVVGNYFPDGARVLDARARSDPLMQMQHSMSRAYNGGVNRILLRTGPGRFRTATGALSERVARGWTLAIGAADLDGDLLPELYFANDFGPDRLLHNESLPGRVLLRELRGRRSFTTPASKVLGTDSFKGMGVDFGDVNGDGRLDIFVSNITSEYALEESNFLWVANGDAGAMRRGRAPFVDRGEPLGVSRSGWAWDVKFGDFANDGSAELIQATGFLKGRTNRWPELQELAMANDNLLRHPGLWPRFAPGDGLSGNERNAFWVQGPSGRFVNLVREVGLVERFVSRGVATGDIDGDGGLDFALANQWDQSYLYVNRSPRRGAFLGLDLRLPPFGRSGQTRVLDHPARGIVARPAFGATAIVHLPGGRLAVGEIDGGNGHASVRAPQFLFGLGQRPTARVVVELRWRDGVGHEWRAHLRLSPGWHTVVLAQR